MRRLYVSMPGRAATRGGTKVEELPVELQEIHIISGAAANIAAYTSREERPCADVWGALEAAKQARRHASCDAAAVALPQLEQRLADLGIELRYDRRADLVHTYELWRRGRRWGWWWPSRGRTRFGNAAGPDCPTAAHLIAYVEQVAPTLPTARQVAPKRAHTIGHAAFGGWLAGQLPPGTISNVWQPKDGAFTRLYTCTGEYVHVSRSSVRCSCDNLRALVEPLLCGVEMTRAGFVVPGVTAIR